MINLLTQNRKLFILITGLFIIVCLLLMILAFRPQSSTDQANPEVIRDDNLFTPAPKPETLPIPTIQDRQNTNLEWIFNYTPPIIPQWSDVYQITDYSLTTNQADQIINSFSYGLGKTQILRGDRVIWNSNDQNQSILISLSGGYIEYTNMVLPGKTDALQEISYSPEQLPQTSIKFLTDHGLMHDDLIFNSQVKYFSTSGDEPIEVSSYEQADTYVVQLNRQLGNTSLFMPSGDSSGATLWISRSGQVTKLSYYYPKVVVVNEPYPIINGSDIQDLLRNNQGIIVNTDFNQEFVEITLNTAELVYLDDRQTAYIQPVLVFKGNGRLTNNQIQPVIVYLPLIQP